MIVDLARTCWIGKGCTNHPGNVACSHERGAGQAEVFPNTLRQTWNEITRPVLSSRDQAQAASLRLSTYSSHILFFSSSSTSTRIHREVDKRNMENSTSFGVRYGDENADLRLMSSDDHEFMIPSYTLQASSSVSPLPLIGRY
jgi:hypothetical protein